MGNQEELCHQGMAGSRLTDVLAIWGLEACFSFPLTKYFRPTPTLEACGLAGTVSGQAPPVWPQPLCQGQLCGLNCDEVTEVTHCVSKQG